MMKHTFTTCILVLLAVSVMSAQVASHTSTTTAQPNGVSAPAPRPVARVNGAVLTDRDLLLEIFTIFPYAKQHGGVIPKEMEPGIRKGAMEMIIFEELVYQEAKRRQMTVPPEKLARAQAAFRKQFSSPDQYQQLMQEEFHGSKKALNDQIIRSLLIDQFMKAEVGSKSVVTAAQLKAYYDKNPQRFAYPESFEIQTISVIPPAKATAAQLQEAHKRAEDALKQAKATKTPEEFGLLAEKISDDDYRVKMGDHGWMARATLPPNVLQAALAMQPGQVSDIQQVDQNYLIFRMNRHVPAGRRPFAEVKGDLRKELQDKTTNQIRAELGKKLRLKAKVEVL